jgi:stress response protein YsnF
MSHSADADPALRQDKDTTMTLRTLMQAGPAKANELFAKLADTSDGAVKTREKLFAELRGELELHVSLEEQHLFPLLRRNAETKELVADAIRDNKDLRAKLNELEAMPKNDPAFAETLADLQKTFRQHARDDKKELLPAVQRALSDEQMQGVAEKMEARLAEVEQAKQDEAEERRVKARQEREEADFLAQQAELRAEQALAVERENAASAERAHETARLVADATFKPAAMAAKAVADVTRVAASGAETGQRAQVQASALSNMFLWPWTSMMPNAPRSGTAAAARGPAAMEEVIPLGEEVLEVGKRTESRGTASIRRFVVETPVERQVTLVSERVVIERRRPVSDQVTGEVLTDVSIEVIETEEVPMVSKRTRVREEIVVRMERSQRVETVKEIVRRDEVEVQQPGRKRGSPQLRAVATQE